ncbi:RdgB/HAM1 family non-canonical purine NTP pyrophosphatase [Peloplasma aerotolerans]|uniref:dITP/XTP pyrophosphatase n=1 Tax=Peloplasma aerotolerans TaxID=3044389 RepID=A0AAW6U3A7_9MOLU|nr:RdgB/HAM1 family non-canonical purine NTP pyrophosphatase [Mariniplasma sp. M4Ah]MDI6452347.1 RdgB/HAM1 family non-canonical purine NTP pyrophosphatase [Mariniplasma sp. M4Ah]
MTKMLVATQNEHKLKEFNKILNHEQIKLVSLKDLNDKDDVIEDGTSFLENATLKACYFAKKHQMITISDDSGLVVEALNGRPGIHSARYSNGGDHENNLKVLKEMENMENRKSHFVSVIVLCYPNGRVKSYEGKVFGYLAQSERGLNGFGYDSIFYVPEYQKTFGELESSIKNQISHRANALKLLKEDIDEIVNNK